MKTNLLFPFKFALVLLALSLFPSLVTAEDIRWQQAFSGDPVETLPKLRDQLDEIIEKHPGDAGRPLVALNSAMVGTTASRAGNHEEALEHLEPSLKTLSEGPWQNVELRIIEFQFRLALADSLQELGRIPEAAKTLDSLFKKTNKGLKREPNARQTQVFGYEEDKDLKATFPQEDWLVALNESLGKLEMAQKNWAAAEAAFKAAAGILERVDPNQLKKLNSLQKAQKKAAQKQGRILRPLLVGRSSNPYSLKIKGAKTFTPEQIKSALAKSSDFIFNSHPETAFEPFLSVTQRCLERGYRAMGFSSPSVDLTWDELSGSVVVNIEEGPRFRSGEVRIEYRNGLADPAARKLKEDQLRNALLPIQKDLLNSQDRADLAFLQTAAKKTIPPARLKKPLQAAFPDHFKDGQRRQFHAEFSHISVGADFEKWQSGKWLSYEPSFQNELGSTIKTAFAEKGLFAPDFDLKFVTNPKKEGTSDLVISIKSEGRPFTLGKVVLADNRLNTRKELLDFLELTEGMPLQNSSIAEIERKLYRSGRFVGWVVIPQKAPEDRPDQFDLFIQVEELWSAPPLTEKTTPEQEAVLKVIDWVNSKAGLEEDFVLDLSLKHPDGPLALKLILNATNLSLSLTGVDHEIHFFLEDNKEAHVLALTPNGSFDANLPVGPRAILAFSHILQAPQESPFLQTGSFNFGLGVGATLERLALLLDPTAAMAMDRFFPVLENDVLILDVSPFEARFNATTGRLISVTLEGSEELLTHPVIARMEKGAAITAHKELQEKIRATDNWLADKAIPSLAFHSLFHAWELFQLFGEDDALALSPSEFTARAAQRAKLREPLAIFLGEVTSALLDTENELENDDEEFWIPLDQSDPTPFGTSSTLVISSGIFDILGRHLEAGSWPEKVVRGIMSVIDQNPVHFNKTHEKLLADPNMGPLGSLVCASLLSKVGHPGAFEFLAKAQETLDEKGFEKDWQLMLSGTGGFDGFGWEILKALKQLDSPDLDHILPLKGSLLRELALKAAKVTPLNKNTLIRPTMNALWEENIRELAVQNLISIRKKLLSRWDPDQVAAIVNGQALPRGALSLEKLHSKTGPPDPLGMSDEDRAIAVLLSAQELWKTGKRPGNDIVMRQAEAVAAKLGGGEKILQLGFTPRAFYQWVGIMISDRAWIEQLPLEKMAAEKEALEFFETAPALNTQNLIHTHIITLAVDGNLAEQQEKAAEIRKRIANSTRGKIFKKKALKAAFVAEAKQHSMDEKSQNGGCFGWKLEQGLPQIMAAEIAKIPDGALSEVITSREAKGTFVYLILVPDARRPVPFKTVRQHAAMGAYYDKLFGNAQIYRIPKLKPIDPNQKAPENKALKNLEQLIGQLMADLNFGDKFKALQNEAKPHPFARLPQPEQAMRGASQGRPDDLYLLGTYSERGLLPKKNGIENALKFYREAAEKGEPKAMFRLAELHRIGRGVKRDAVKQQEWQARAAKALKSQ